MGKPKSSSSRFQRTGSSSKMYVIGWTSTPLPPTCSARTAHWCFSRRPVALYGTSRVPLENNSRYVPVETDRTLPRPELHAANKKICPGRLWQTQQAPAFVPAQDARTKACCSKEFSRCQLLQAKLPLFSPAHLQAIGGCCFCVGAIVHMFLRGGSCSHDRRWVHDRTHRSWGHALHARRSALALQVGKHRYRALL